MSFLEYNIQVMAKLFVIISAFAVLVSTQSQCDYTPDELNSYCQNKLNNPEAIWDFSEGKCILKKVEKCSTVAENKQNYCCQVELNSTNAIWDFKNNICQILDPVGECTDVDPEDRDMCCQEVFDSPEATWDRETSMCILP